MNSEKVPPVFCTHCGKRLKKEYDPVRYDALTGNKLPQGNLCALFCNNLDCTEHLMTVWSVRGD